ncbi:hypothetical protein [Kribbella turkmenica]|nr:hypothetical protein [Kribbella turkmenica]
MDLLACQDELAMKVIEHADQISTYLGCHSMSVAGYTQTGLLIACVSIV